MTNVFPLTTFSNPVRVVRVLLEADFGCADAFLAFLVMMCVFALSLALGSLQDIDDSGAADAFSISLFSPVFLFVLLD